MSKVYIGTPGAEGPVVWVKDETLALSVRLTHHVRHSPDGFNWGYGGLGPSDLARCILLDYFDGAVKDEEREWVEAHYQDFKFDVIAGLPSAGFHLPAREVGEWVEAEWAHSEV